MEKKEYKAKGWSWTHGSNDACTNGTTPYTRFTSRQTKIKFNIHCFLNTFLYSNDIDTRGKKEISNFLGAFPADVLPYTDQNSCCWIWNTDDSIRSGELWIVIRINGRNLFFFDSFGFPLQKYQKHWKNFTNKLNVTTVCKNTIQNPLSVTCGMWSLLYLAKTLKMSDFNQISIKGKISQNAMIKTLNNEKRLFDIAKHTFPNMNAIYINQCKKRSKNSQCCRNLLSFINKT